MNAAAVIAMTTRSITSAAAVTTMTTRSITSAAAVIITTTNITITNTSTTMVPVSGRSTSWKT